MCGHAYVLNLKAVKVLVEQFIPCGRSGGRAVARVGQTKAAEVA